MASSSVNRQSRSTIYEGDNYALYSMNLKKTFPLVDAGLLTEEQMERATKRYCLQSSEDGGVIFWQIDEQQQIREGKIMYYGTDGHRLHNRHPISISWKMKNSNPPQLPADWKATPCLFGLHLIAEDAESPIAIVESEKTAVIMSERMSHKGFLWMATGGKGNLTIARLMPLKGRRIIIFPDTDPDGSTYHEWRKTAEAAALHLGHPIYVSDILERLASEEQKKQKIDIADLDY